MFLVRKLTFTFPIRCTFLSELQQNLLEPPQLVNDELVSFEADTPTFANRVQLPRIGTNILVNVVVGGLTLRYRRSPEEQLEPVGNISVGLLSAELATSGIDNSVAELTLTLDSVLLEDLRYFDTGTELLNGKPVDLANDLPDPTLVLQTQSL